MITTVFDYLKWRGDLTFKQDKMNIIDIFMLCQLPIIDLEEIVPKNDECITFKEVMDKYHEKKNGDRELGLIIPTQFLDLLDLMAKSNRFKDTKISKYFNKMDLEIQEQIAAGVDPREICVVARTNALVDDYKKYLAAAGIDSFEVKRRQADDRSRMGVRLATMHRVKGLEFITVFIVAANKNYIPLKSAINRTDPAEREAAIVSERCLLYVAMTRAKKKVMISSYGAISEFLR